MYSVQKESSNTAGRMKRLTIFAIATLGMVGCAFLLFDSLKPNEIEDTSSTAGATQLQSLHQDGQMTVADALGFLQKHDTLQSTTIKKQAQIINQLRTENAKLKKVEYELDSLILSPGGHATKWDFKNMLPGAKNLELVYRGSRDGWTGAQFHALADGQGETLTVMKTVTGNIMGGYTDISWEGTVPENRLAGNRKSFIYHYEDNGVFRKFMFDGRSSNKEILNCNRMLTWWEWGIMVWANPHINGGSGSYVNSNNYQVPAGVNGPNYYVNDGVSKFQLVEMELYKVIR